MEVELSDIAIRKICYSLWFVETMEKNKERFSDNEDLVMQVEEVGRKAIEVMAELSAEQLDTVLEEYKRSNDEFNKEFGYE